MATPMVGVGQLRIQGSCFLFVRAVHIARDNTVELLRKVLEKQRVVHESGHFSVPLSDGTVSRLSCMPMVLLCD